MCKASRPPHITPIPRAAVHVAATIEEAVRLSQEMAAAQKRRVYVAGGLFLAIEYATIAKGGRARGFGIFLNVAHNPCS